MCTYRGNIYTLDWTNLEVLKLVAQSLKGVIAKHPNRPNYNIYGTVEQAEKSGAVVIWPVSRGNHTR